MLPRDLSQLPNCPACRSKAVKPRSRPSQIGDAPLLRCDACGLTFLVPGVNDQRRHDDRYHRALEEHGNPKTADADARDFLDYWTPKLGFTRGRLLEIGCADGTLLLAAGKRGIRAVGLDVSDYFVERWRSLDLDAHVGTIEDFSAAHPDSFDLIVARQVIEHVADSRAFLRGCRRALRSSGNCLIETGDAGSIQAKLMGKRWAYWSAEEGPGYHVTFFDRRSMQTLARQVGLRLEGSIPQLRYRSLASYIEQHPNSPKLVAAGKFLLLRSRASAGRCYWLRAA
jgi:SAM-dependent methyltransferase